MITVYAQNFEDVLLWRALGSIDKGHYVDVGAHDPDFASVTRLFYEHGWRGINVEPVPSMFEKLQDRRPEDRNLKVACSDTDGELVLYEVVDTGLSTLDSAHADEIRAEGWKVVEHKTPVMRLDTILGEYGAGEIHFLKIDVEGVEKAVLDGCDLTKWRPWVLVIEATAPLSQKVVSDLWEPGVLTADYTKVYFDGLNNYYVSSEHPELSDAFGLQPNCFDSFVLAPDHGLVDQQERLALLAEQSSLHAEAEQATAELQRLRTLVETLESLVQQSEDWARATEAQLLRSEENVNAIREQAQEAAQAAQIARAENDLIRQTVSWRVTAPLRVARVVAAKTAKLTAKPVLNAGLNAVRHDEALKARARRVLHAAPGLESRFQRYANNRPVREDNQ